MSNREDRQNQRFPWPWVVGVGIALASLGGAAAWFNSRQLPPNSETLNPNPAVSVPSPSPSLAPQASPSTVSRTLTVYWLKVTPEKSELLPASVTLVLKDGSKASDLELAMKALLEIPNDPDYTTAIPAGTKLLGWRQDAEGIHLNFSGEFAAGEGPNLLIGRLGQVIYTATNQDPKAKVWISVEGKPLEILGPGDGLLVEQPLTRKSFQENYEF
jgi:spore germination protein GerM